MINLYDVLRFVVLLAFIGAAGVAVGGWAVRTQRINPFGRLGRTIRRLSDPLLTPLESFLLRRGGNPQNAGWWLLGITIVGGIVALSLVQWLYVQVTTTTRIASRGARGVLWLAVYYASLAVIFSLFVRVIGSWLGKGRFSPGMRPFYWLTDWIVEPLRRVVPPFGIFDVTPIIALFLIWFLRAIVLGLL
ncbi:MAG: YggT family protein [Gemmatimonadales bacterium]